MPTGTIHSTISPVIQASLSPVFLLSAIGTSLLIIDTRLNRIVDRCRVLEAGLTASPGRDERSEDELLFYLGRANRVRWATVFCTIAALTLAFVVVALFIDAQTTFELALVVEVLFTCAVLFLVVGLVLYLQDVLMVHRALEFTRGRVADAQAGGRPGRHDAEMPATGPSDGSADGGPPFR
jgi:hypothetical protein